MNTLSKDRLNTSFLLNKLNKFVSNKIKGGAEKSKKGGTSGRTVPKKLVDVKSKVYAINTNRTHYNPYRKFAHATHVTHVVPRRLSPVRENSADLVDLFGRMHTSTMAHKRATNAVQKHVLPSIDDELARLFGSMTTSAMARNRATKAIKGTRKSIKKPSTKPEKMSIEPTRRSARVSKAPSKLSTSSKGKSYRNK